jgi:hypothetical protein
LRMDVSREKHEAFEDGCVEGGNERDENGG